MNVFLLQCCLALFFAIILVVILVCLEDVRFGMMAHQELKRFRYQLRKEIFEDIQELLQKNLDEGDWWKDV